MCFRRKGPPAPDTDWVSKLDGFVGFGVRGFGFFKVRDGGFDWGTCEHRGFP